MNKCEKCNTTDYVYLSHDRNDEKKVKYLCDTCNNYPEYYVDCPHCEARIPVN
jgi:hypothetical protein